MVHVYPPTVSSSRPRTILPHDSTCTNDMSEIRRNTPFKKRSMGMSTPTPAFGKKRYRQEVEQTKPSSSSSQSLGAGIHNSKTQASEYGSGIPGLYSPLPTVGNGVGFAAGNLGLVALAAQQVGEENRHSGWITHPHMFQPYQLSFMGNKPMMEETCFAPLKQQAYIHDQEIINLKEAKETTHFLQDSVNETRRESIRYTMTETKALVHAKLRLQISGNFGEKITERAGVLSQYYEYYLKLLDEKGFHGYSKREESALIRKFKSIKSGSPLLYSYLDPVIEDGIWCKLRDLIMEKPMLSKSEKSIKHVETSKSKRLKV